MMTKCRKPSGQFKRCNRGSAGRAVVGRRSYDDDEDDLRPEEDDLVTEDHVHFYQSGREVLTLQVAEQRRSGGSFAKPSYRPAKEGELSDQAMWKQLDALMKRQGFYPNVWWISDHGNPHLMQRPKRRR